MYSGRTGSGFGGSICRPYRRFPTTVAGVVKQGTSHLECFLSLSPEVVAPTLTFTWSPHPSSSLMVALVPTSACRCYCSRFHPQRWWVVTCKAVELSLRGTGSVREGDHVVARRHSRWFEESTFSVFLLSLQLPFAFVEMLPHCNWSVTT
jgi:hypothetical protein